MWNIKSRVEAAGKAIARSIIGIVFLLIGAAFLIALGWMLVAEEWGALVATGAAGAMFSLVGLLALWSARRVSKRAKRPDQIAPAMDSVSPEVLQSVLAAFSAGVQAGQAARGRH